MNGYLSVLELRAAKHPDRTAVMETSGRGRQLTWKELVQNVRDLSTGLAGRGMRPGDHVLFSVKPSLDSLLLILAIHETGGVIVPVDPGSGERLFRARIAMLNPRWAFAESFLLVPWVRTLLRLKGTQLVSLAASGIENIVYSGPWLPLLPRGSMSITKLAGSADGSSLTRPALDANDEAFIVFTSGTTGEPKGVVHTRSSLDAILQRISRELDANESDVFYSRELHLILPALFAGATVVVPQRTSFLAAKMIEECERFEVTHTFVVTADGRSLSEYCASHKRQLPVSLRRLFIGGAPVPATFLDGLKAAVHPSLHVFGIYGMTEILPVARVSLEERLAYRGDGDFVGTPVEGVEVWVDSDGELVVRGPGLFARYLGQPNVSEHRTGDLATISDQGIVLLGRSRDMIIRGEYNIYPPLYEWAFERTEGVRRCVLLGVPDAGGSDELVVAVVEPKRGADPVALVHAVRRDLKRGVIDIDAFAHPDHILCFEIPLSGRSSKVDRDSLLRMIRERLV